MSSRILLRVVTIAFFLFSRVGLAAPATWVQPVTYDGQTVTMRLTRENLRGAHFELWAQNSAGAYDVVTPVDERSYLGSVDGYPGAVACGILKDNGHFRGAIYFDRGVTWFTLGTAVVKTRALDYGDFEAFQFPTTPTVQPGQAGSTMYAYNLGVDADYDYFAEAGSGIAQAFEGIEYSVCVVRAIYMRDVLLRPYLGRVIIRASQAHDPYTGLTQGSYLRALRSEWKSNHADADTDLVAGTSPTKIGGGLAWVGVVGSSSKYSVNGSGSNGEFDVVFRHEMGHNWGCGHFVGGKPEGAGLMGGNRPGRFSGCEAYRVFNHRDSRIAKGGILDAEGIYRAIELPPYASLDAGEFVQTISSPTLFDVLANDHDANGQSLSLVSFDAASAKGGTVTRAGNRLVYTPHGAFLGTDSFLYTIADSASRTATGVCIIDVQPNDPMLAYLPLNESSGSSAADCSSFARTYELSGTDFGSASTDGKYGRALNFDGVDDHIELSQVHHESNRLTLTAWVKPDSAQNPWAGIIFDRASATAGLNVGNNGELRYHWRDRYWGWNSGLTPPPNRWTFVALVVEPSRATVYMNDGSGLRSAVNMASHAVAPFASPRVGSDASRNSRHFRGAIDEVRIFNHALSRAEVQRVYAGGGTGSPIPFNGAREVESPWVSWCPDATATAFHVYAGTNRIAVANATQSSPEFRSATATPTALLELAPAIQYYWRVDAVTPSGTVAGDVWAFATAAQLESISDDLITHLTMDASDISGSTITDTSGAPTYNATIVTSSGFPPGQINEALRLNGAGDHAVIPPMHLNTDTLTISAWIRRLGVQSDWAGIVFSRSGSTVAGLNLGHDHELRYHWNDGQWGWDSGLIVPDGQWVHVALVVEPGQATIYLNGEASVHKASHGREEFNGLTRIGRDRSGRSFKGDMDDVAIWRRALSPGEIAYIHEQGLAGRSFQSLRDTDGDGIPDVTDLDDDNDGMPDTWEERHSLNPLVDDAAGDPDLDGQNNSYEYAVDTDPRNANSRQMFSAEPGPDGNRLTIRFSTSANRRYSVEVGDDLHEGNWQQLSPAFPGNGAVMSVTEPASGPHRYYRLRIIGAGVKP